MPKNKLNRETNVTQAQIADLAAVEMPCTGLCNNAEEIRHTVARFSWAKVEPCEHPAFHDHDNEHANGRSDCFLPITCAQHRGICPGYRAATLEEIDLEAVLVAGDVAVSPSEWPGKPKWQAQHPHFKVERGDTPKAAAIAAVHAAWRAEAE